MMTVKETAEQFAQLVEDRVPEFRFLQAIVNFQSWKGSDCFYIDNARFIVEFQEFLNDIVGNDE